MKTTLTYKQFNEICEEVEKMVYKPENWYPTVEEIEKYILPNPHAYLKFMLWILENNDLPQSDADKESFNLLNKIIKENYEFVED
jgi:hypothetical protein